MQEALLCDASQQAGLINQYKTLTALSRAVVSIWPGRLTVRTLAFQARNQSSILCRAAKVH
jgi:hypothetical protein